MAVAAHKSAPARPIENGSSVAAAAAAASVAADKQPAASRAAQQPGECERSSSSGSQGDAALGLAPTDLSAAATTAMDPATTAAEAAEDGRAEPAAAPAVDAAAPAPGSSSSLPADPEGLTLHLALQLYGLTRYRELFGAEHDAKCVLGWGEDGTVVICFRGTTSLVNITNNLKVSRGQLGSMRICYFGWGGWVLCVLRLRPQERHSGQRCRPFWRDAEVLYRWRCLLGETCY